MAQPGAIGYVLTNFDGIPVKYFPEDLPFVQISALVSDLVMKTKSTLKQLDPGNSDFVYLRMRTKQDTEFIVTNSQISGSTNEYILVCIQKSIFKVEEEEDEEEAKWYSCDKHWNR